MNKLASICLSFAIFTTITQAKEPAWVKDISKGCKKRKELCAVGIGEGKGQATRHARVELAKIFENKLSSKFKSNLSSSGQDILEDLSEEIEETTDVVLEGVSIKATYEDSTDFYALAVVNKSKVISGLMKEIRKIDEKMKVLVSENSGSATVKLERYYLKREILLKKYEFLSGGSIKSPVSFGEIFAKKKATVNSMIIHVYVDEDDPKLMEAAIVKSLSDSGYRITTGRKRNKHSTHVVTGELVTDKQYMKVEGFEKYKINLKLSAWSKGKVETGHLNFSSTEVGRSESQAFEKAVPKLESYIQDNITKLNID
ncbi:MAG: LPP20 family lipoprotein [Bacteriovoracaceae bacterium]|jgi:hypothetical protein|nr:LPP20 family lipoprotein [Bacteriovoracaceae bacterium]